MEVNRNGESGPVPFRSGRFFNVGSAWYFATREALDQGPYPSRQEAETALAMYIENVRQVERHWR